MLGSTGCVPMKVNPTRHEVQQRSQRIQHDGARYAEERKPNRDKEGQRSHQDSALREADHFFMDIGRNQTVKSRRIAPVGVENSPHHD